MLKDRIYKLISNEGVGTIPSSELTSSTNLFEIGFDSLRYMELIVYIEEEFNMSVPDEMLEISPSTTIGDIIQTLENEFI